MKNKFFFLFIICILLIVPLSFAKMRIEEVSAGAGVIDSGGILLPSSGSQTTGTPKLLDVGGILLPKKIDSGKSVVYYLKELNNKLFSGGSVELAGTQVSVKQKAQTSSAGCDDSVETQCPIGLVAKSSNLSVVKYQGENEAYTGKAVFVASIPSPYLNQGFWIDLSGYSEKIKTSPTKPINTFHRKYLFNVMAFSEENEADDYFRFIHFDVKSTSGEKAVITSNYSGTLDCTLALKGSTWANYYESARATAREQGWVETGKDLVKSMFSGYVAGKVGKVGYSTAGAIATKPIGSAVAKIGLLRVGTKVVLKSLGYTVFAGTVLSQTSRYGVADNYTANLSWYDLENWFPNLVSKRLHVDFLNSAVVPCQEETINNYEFRGPDFKFNFVDSVVPEKDGDVVKIYFTLDLAQEVGFDGADTKYYDTLPLND